jgi:hypothetical protein
MQLDTHKQLLSRLGSIVKHHKELSRLSGADFNIFRIIHVTCDELKHSAFLSELLNPRGSHGQGDVFLRLFVHKFGIENFQCETAEALVEKHVGQLTETEGGRIDILIDDHQGNHIIIENKIYAGDQDNQLIRYHNFSKQNLFYLNLYGVDASPKSNTNDKFGKKLVCGKDYKLLSYKIDILEWLELCLKETVSMPLLREGITHYINLIKHLTGETINKAMQKEIVNLITESPTNLANAKEIANNYTEAQSHLLWGFWKALKNELRSSGMELEDWKANVSQERTLNYFRRKDHLFGLLSLIYSKGEITIHFVFEMQDNIMMGFTLEKNTIGKISDLPENAKYRNVIHNCDSKYKNNPWCLGMQETNPNLNFREFSSETILNLTNKDELEKIVRKIAEKAQSDIEFVQRELEKMEST